MAVDRFRSIPDIAGTFRSEPETGYHHRPPKAARWRALRGGAGPRRGVATRGPARAWVFICSRGGRAGAGGWRWNWLNFPVKIYNRCDRPRGRGHIGSQFLRQKIFCQRWQRDRKTAAGQPAYAGPAAGTTPTRCLRRSRITQAGAIGEPASALAVVNPPRANVDAEQSSTNQMLGAQVGGSPLSQALVTLSGAMVAAAFGWFLVSSSRRRVSVSTGT
jgi:hypothetical protein